MGAENKRVIIQGKGAIIKIRELGDKWESSRGL